MQRFKDRWEIKKNWQLLFPIVGIIGLLFCGYLISKTILVNLLGIDKDSSAYLGVLSALVIFCTYLLLRITLKLFKPLETRWNVTYRWELIAIFIVFAITGSTAAKISNPLLSAIGITSETVSSWIFWPIRILIIFPIYQVLLVIVGWLFGQFDFFWDFEKKMLRRIGFARFLKD